MRSVRVFATAVIIGVSALAAGCGQQPGAAASGPASTPAAVTCGTAVAALGPGRTLTLGTTDNRRSYCVKRGTGVLIFLRGTATDKWSELTSSSAALKPSANGRLTLALGVTGGFFVAARPGTAVITSARSGCGPSSSPPTTPVPSGQASCGPAGLFRVTITVA
jgi:hypothetical protein